MPFLFSRIMDYNLFTLRQAVRAPGGSTRPRPGRFVGIALGFFDPGPRRKMLRFPGGRAILYRSCTTSYEAGGAAGLSDPAENRETGATPVRFRHCMRRFTTGQPRARRPAIRLVQGRAAPEITES